MTLPDPLIAAPFSAPVAGFCTTRRGGVSIGAHASLNLGGACGDDPGRVAVNRGRLETLLPSTPHWLNQVHGTRLIHLDDWIEGVEADAAWTDRPGQVAAVLTADCLPVLVAERYGACVAAIHAGWRGLAAGVIEATVRSLPVGPDRLQAWIGPRIGPGNYEVDESVHSAFAGHSARFKPVRAGHWLADLPGIARAKLNAAGIERVADCDRCTMAEPDLFFSYRRDHNTGRMASVIWIT